MKEWVRNHSITPLVVRNQEEAKDFNRREAALRWAFPGYTGHHWKVGEKYYIMAVSPEETTHPVPA